VHKKGLTSQAIHNLVTWYSPFRWRSPRHLRAVFAKSLPWQQFFETSRKRYHGSRKRCRGSSFENLCHGSSFSAENTAVAAVSKSLLWQQLFNRKRCRGRTFLPWPVSSNFLRRRTPSSCMTFALRSFIANTVVSSSPRLTRRSANKKKRQSYGSSHHAVP
jgi:hypothetical protein